MNALAFDAFHNGHKLLRDGSVSQRKDVLRSYRAAYRRQIVAPDPGIRCVLRISHGVSKES
jgi:hypothetical protein